MNIRERFLSIMDFDISVLPPRWEMGYWVGAIRRWYKEGLAKNDGVPEDVPSGVGLGGWYQRVISTYRCKFMDVDKALNLDSQVHHLPVEVWIFPEFEPRIIKKEDNGSSIITDTMGVTKKVDKEDSSIPYYYDWPVKTEKEWETFKAERLSSKTPGRYPENLNKLIEEYKERNYLLDAGGWPMGFFGALRYLMGEVKLLTSYYDNPQLIKNIIDYLVDFWIELFSPVLTRVTPDCFRIWEDMCYKSAPLISPDLFRKFMLPAYKKFIGFLKECGIKNILVDTDGNAWKLIPLFIEGGVTGLYPMEVAADMDVVGVRKSFPKLQMVGGIDKRVVAKSEKDIDLELESKIPFMIKEGGYIPQIDHLIPPDISFQNLLYYRRKLDRLMEQAIV